jgi:hypothetical protein
MRRILVTTVLLVAALGLAGCSASSGTSRSDSSGNSGSSASRVPAIAPEKGTTGSGTGTVGTAPQPTSGRAVITIGTISITVDTPSTAAEKAVRIADAAGGHVDGRTEHPSTGGDQGSARLVLRIPNTRLDAVLAELKKLGRVENLSLSTQDVTGQSQDLDARITALTTSVDRLVELMSRATTTADLISIESALSDRQANLESLQAQKRGLDDQVELATLTVEFGTVATAPVRPPATFLSGLIAGWDSFVTFLSGALVVVGVALPWLAFAALLATITVLVVRRRRIRAVRES